MTRLVSMLSSIDSGIRFATDIPLWQIFILCAISAVLVCWLYLRQLRSISGPAVLILPALRAAAVVMTVLLFAQPVWHRRTTKGVLGKVVFAIDVSGSMSTSLSPGEKTSTRWKQASRWLRGTADRAGWIETLRSSHEVDVVAFDDKEEVLLRTGGVSESESLGDVLAGLDGDLQRAGGRTSRLARGLSAVISPESADENEPGLATQPASSNGRQVVILISDGQGMDTAEAIETARQLRSLGIDVVTVGMGTEQEPVDMGITSVESPTNVATDGQISGRIAVKTIAEPGALIDVQLRLRTPASPNGEVVWQRTLETNDQVTRLLTYQLAVKDLLRAFKPEVPVAESSNEESIAVKQRQSHVLELFATVDSEGVRDAVKLNDRFDFRVSTSDRDRTLLIMDGSSRWETRYIRNVFDRDPSWDVTTLLFGPGTDRPTVTRGERPDQIPVLREDWAKYDAIVLGEIPPELWTDQDSSRLREYVSRGGGLVLIDGALARLPRLRERGLSELFPVRHRKSRGITADTSDEDATNALFGPLVDVERLVPSPAAAELPLFNLASSLRESRDLWTALPVMSRISDVSEMPDSEVWATVRRRGNQSSAWIVTKQFGGGRVVYLASDQTWRWRYKVADRFHARFWNQMLAAVIPTTFSVRDEFVSLGTDQVEYSADQTPVINVRLRDANGSPQGDATVDATLMQDGQTVGIIPLVPVDPSRGLYQGIAEKLPVGRYDVGVRASGYGSETLSVSTPIWIESRMGDEWNRLSQNSAHLREIAAAADGEYLDQSEAEDEILPLVRPLSSGVVIESNYPLWQSWPWFVAIVTLLVIELWWRKKIGMI